MTIIERTVPMDLGTSDVSTPAGGGGAPARKRSAKAKTKALAKTARPKAKGRRLHIRADLASGGSLHVRHHTMSDGERILCLEGQAVTLADDAAKPVWIQLAKPGTFRGHPAGPFELNDKVFAEIIANFKATENQHIPVDFEHASEAEATAGSIPIEGAPAQGWIIDLKIQGGCLWGLVEWGDKAREYIKTKKYKYFSPAIRFGARDRVTGKQIGARMTSGGLTNNPFLDGMRPLAARDGALGDRVLTPAEAVAYYGTTLTESHDAMTMRLAHSPSEYMPQVRYVLGLSDLSTAAECLDQLERLRQHFDATGQDPDDSHEGIAMARFVYPLRNLVNASIGTTWDQVFDAVDALIASATVDDEEDEDEPAFDVGDRVEALVDHMPGMKGMTGSIAEAHAGAPPYYAVTFDGQTEPHKWLAENEIRAVDDGDGMHNATSGAAMRATTNRNDAGAIAGENAMTPEQIAALNTQVAESKVALKDATTKLTAAEAAAAETNAKVADLTLSLKDEASKRETAETELKTLRDEKTARETKDLTDRVTLAFETYKDVQKLTDDDKETMLIVLKARPESFEKKYPKVAPAQQHLLTNLTDKREVIVPTLMGDDGGKGKPVDIAKAARQLSAQKGIPLAEAQRILMRSGQPAPTARR